MKIHELLEQAAQLRANTIAFLGKWTTGSSKAPLHLTSVVKQDLKQTVTEDSYTVYRGWKFADEDLVADIFGSNHTEIKPGANMTVKLDSPHSWTKDKAEALKFANPRFDSLEKEWFDDETIGDMGYEHGDLLGIGILVSATIPASKVIADLGNVDADVLSYDDEQEIITDRGQFEVTVLDVVVHSFDGEDTSDGDDMSEKEWEIHNREAEDENIHMAKMRNELPALLQKHKLKPTSDGLKKLLELEPKQDVAIAILMTYGHDMPELKDHIKAHAASYTKVYKHFNVQYIIQMINSIAAFSKADLGKWESEA